MKHLQSFVFVIISLITLSHGREIQKSCDSNFSCNFEITNNKNLFDDDESFIKCNYIFSGPDLYCDLQISNREGRDDFERIEGTLPPLFRYDDVESIFSIGQFSLNFPSIICRQFNNLKSIIMYFGIIQIIDRNSFENCRNLVELRLDFNAIFYIAGDSFINLSKLNSLSLRNNDFSYLRLGMFKGIENSLLILNLNHNFISSIEFGFFDEFQMLKEINFSNNNLTTIDLRSFGNSVISLEIFQAENNRIFFIDNQWFDNAIFLDKLQLDNNLCINESFYDVGLNREAVRRQLEQCFKNFNNPPDFIRCEYYLNDDEKIECELFINNPNGRDDFTEIEGELPSNKTFADVVTVYMESQQTSIIPSILCNSFPNLSFLGAMASGILEISSTSIQNCRNLTAFYIFLEFLQNLPEDLFVNQPQLIDVIIAFTSIGNIPARLFETNYELHEVHLGYNYLSEIPFGLFVNNQNLQVLSFEVNQIEVIDSRSFGSLNDLLSFGAYDNQIFAIDSKWFDFIPNIDTLIFTNNICVDKSFSSINENRVEVKRQLEQCFENFINPPERDFIRCEYYLRDDGKIECELLINNPKGRDVFTEIEGELPSNKTFADVVTVFIGFQQTSIIPSIICQSYSNLIFLGTMASGILEISSTSIQNCRNLTSFYIFLDFLQNLPEDLFVNQEQLFDVIFTLTLIENIPARLFETNFELQEVYFGYNQLTEIPFGLFANNQNLKALSFEENQIEVIDSRSFRSLNDLILFDANKNKIFAIDNQWFDLISNVDQLLFTNNICIDEIFYDVGLNREEVRRQLEQCFENFNNPPETTTIPQKEFIECEYYLKFDDSVGCNLLINNPNGRDDFIEIEGKILFY